MGRARAPCQETEAASVPRRKTLFGYLVVLVLVLAVVQYGLNISISPLAFLLLVAFVSMTATAILYAYDVHAREPEEENWEQLLKQEMRSTKDLVKEPNRHIYQYLG